MGDDLSSRKEVEAIRKTAERAANLTRQLLAFSRSQILQSKVLDLNSIVMNMDKMLRRLIGEHIDLLSVKGKDLWPVEADPGQLEQVIMNLTVNARDAMSNGGELLIETCNLTVDDSAKGEVPPGKYVTLTVADTGCGMSPEVQKRIFEPFFTTKEVGRGTGLGLSTVYGIVKQSGGHITVQSVLEKGTAFSLYLPMSERAILEMGTGKIRLEQFKGNEVILLVEDEEEVRAVIIKVLNQQGYTVLVAVNGSEALMVFERHSGRIDLLLTDLVMPIMGGTELVEKLASRRPDIKILYMSGYTNSDSVRQRILSAGSAFLQKPFTPTELARAVRETLDAGKKTNV
jgi:CheY-like chemotaxis protein